jgi:hypothetical protein
MTIGPVAVAALEPTPRFHDIDVPLSVKLCIPDARVGHVAAAVGRSGGVCPPCAAAPLLEPDPPLDPDPLLDPDECAPPLPVPLLLLPPLLPVPPLPVPPLVPLLPAPPLEPLPEPELLSAPPLPDPRNPPELLLDEPHDASHPSPARSPTAAAARKPLEKIRPMTALP